MNNTFSKKSLLTAALLIAFGATGRILLQDLPNIETILVVTLLAGVLLGGPWTIIVGLATIAITDAVIGNSAIMLYTWSAWAVMGALGWALRKHNKAPAALTLKLTGMGVLGTLFFFLWTNFGVWQIGGLYPATFDGLIQSYVAALPFLRMHMISTLLFVPTVSFAALTIWNAIAQRSVHAPTLAYGKRG